MSDFKYERVASGYAVRLDGVFLGTVWKIERRYNLRRPLVVRGWGARPPNGPTLGRENGGEAAVFSTRDIAARALSREETT
jgi:hypothetical protein